MTKNRRTEIRSMLSATPITATMLAEHFGVSRQIIVSDIALLRASGDDILSTPRGYIRNAPSPKEGYYTVTCMHNEEQLPLELYAIVDQGATIVDVVIDHGVYGQIQCPLYLTTRLHCDQFLEKIRNSNSGPLCQLTQGMHMHTIACKDRLCYEQVVAALTKLNFLVDSSENPYYNYLQVSRHL